MSKDAVIDYFKLADAGIVSFAPFNILETNSANKYYDYLACGLPVVINYGGWQKAVLEQMHAGYSEVTSTAAADRLIGLAHNLSLQKQLSVHARALAEQAYDRNVIAEQLSKLILQHASVAAYSQKA